jgi:Bacterial protein of unknown function (HtrL_YibB)
MTTIVSAFLSNVNQYRSLEVYYNHGKILFQSITPKIIFLDPEMIKLVKITDYNPENTIIVEYNKDDSYLFQKKYENCIANFHLNTDSSKKDTLDYILTQCNKTEWIKKAIELNPFSTDNFIWIDFGCRHVFNCSDDKYILKLNRLQYVRYENIRIPRIWDLNIQYNVDLYKNITWYFAGGVFGGHRDKLVEFANLMSDKCLHLINTYHIIMWEVNVWYLIYLEHKELFDPYISNHNNTIIDNY